MKKMIGILLAVLLLAGLGSFAFAEAAAELQEPLNEDSPEVTVEALLAANMPEAVFSRHGNVLIRTEYEPGDVSSVFLTSDFACDLDTGNLYDAADNWRLLEVNGETAFAFDWFAMSEEERDAAIWKPEYLFPHLQEVVLQKAEFSDVVTNEDGSLSFTCLVNAEDLAALLESFGNPLPEEYAGMEQCIEFTLDAETLEQLVCEEYTVFGEEKTRISRMEMEYDAEQPEMVTEMLALAEEFRSMEPENPRTVTVIYDAGTDAEESYSVVTDRKFRVVPFLREGYGLFSDPEGTEPFLSRDEVTDAVIYAFPAE